MAQILPRQQVLVVPQDFILVTVKKETIIKCCLVDRGYKVLNYSLEVINILCICGKILLCVPMFSS
jgi:hypothetical protein